MSLPEYLPTDLPQYVKVNSRAEFSSSVVGSDHVLLFAESASSGVNLVAKNQDGTYTEIAGGSGGIVTSDGNITSGAVLSGYVGYNSSGRVEGAIPSLGSSSYTVGSAGLTLSGGVYLSGNQSFTMDSSGIIEVSSTTAEAGDVLSGKVFFDSAGTLTSGTLTVSSGGGVEVGYVASVVSGSALFQPIAFSGGTAAYDDGSAVYVASSGTFALPVPAESGVKLYSSGAVVSSAGSVSGVSVGSGAGADAITVFSGGTADIAVISSGGTLTMSGGTAVISSAVPGAVVSRNQWWRYVKMTGPDFVEVWSSSVLVSSAGSLSSAVISAPLEADACGAVILDTVTVESGGRLNIRGTSGAIANGITVGNGGEVDMTAPASFSLTTVSSGGTMTVRDAELQTDMAVLTGGALTVNGSGVLTGIQTVSAYGGTISIGSGASIGGGILEAASGGSITASGGGESAALHALDGGTADLYSASVDMGYIAPGGTMTIHSGGKITGSGIVSSGGTLTVSSGGTALNITSETGAVIIHPESGAVITYA